MVKLNALWKFLTLFCVCYFLETITFTYLISAVQSIERQFQIPSRLSGTLMSSSDIGYVLTVVVLAYFGSRGNRARWIGAGCMLIAFACLLISLPSFIFPPDDHQANNVTLEKFAATANLITISEIDQPIKLIKHPTLGCAILEWLDKTRRLHPVGWIWSVENEIFSSATLKCGTSNDTFFKELPKLIQLELIPFLAGDYDTFANALVNRLNETKIPSNQMKLLYNHAKASYAFCDRLVNKLRTFIETVKCENGTTNQAAFAIILIGIIFIGVGHSMPWTLGMPLIDDYVKKRNTPLYFAGVFFIRILGPVLGFMLGSVCNRFHYDLSSMPGLDPTDIGWIGAWWLGFLVIFSLLLLPSALLFCFPPQEIPQKMESELQSQTEPMVQSTKSSLAKSEMKAFMQSLMIILRTPIYTITLIGRMFDTLAFKGFFVFQPKYIESQFDIPQYKANLFIGSLGIVGFALGTVMGSIIMRKLRLEGRCNSVLSEIGKLGKLNSFNYSNSCNEYCACDRQSLFPVCSASGQPFLSPCHAGCREIINTGSTLNFTNCLCLDTGNSASRSWCSENCNQPLAVYFILFTIGGVISGTSVIPGVLMVLRSIPVKLRSVGLGLSAFLISLFCTFPSPIIYGYIIDGTCLLWNKKCGQQGSCSIYDSDKLRNRYFGFNGILRLIGLFFDIAICYYAKDLRLMSENGEDDVRRTTNLKRSASLNFSQKFLMQILLISLCIFLLCECCSSLPLVITPGIAHLFPNFPYWPDSQSIPGFDPYLTPYSNWNVLKGFQPNDPKYYEFMQPIGLPKWVGVIINGIRVGNNGLLNTLLE
ncbi:Solute carrier organic anion transporter family member 1A6 [Trichinella zimbabwensis]|uniref:Solute carrier organic anion transporter family member 1A6 n=1 Tax=Trichinella zimbabwensis TaxID=268475 RepID=A0A0V1HQ87_9BILA|nr:Solute carrier organic anion transporter family member 1A6 [Trichinella zimbabwensis]